MSFIANNSILIRSVPMILFVGVIIVLAVVVFSNLTRSARINKKYNQNAPMLTVSATVTAKRSDVGSIHPAANNKTSRTTYYLTFEVASGDRIEFEVLDTEYGMIVEKDMGKLTFQGTKYLGFERNKF